MDGTVSGVKETHLLIKNLFDKGSATSGIILIAKDNNQCYYTDIKGNKLFQQKFDECQPFRNNKAIVKKGNYYHVIDSEGNDLYTGKNDKVVRVLEQFAIVSREGKMHSIDTKGKQIEPTTFDNIYKEGYTEQPILLNGKMGLLGANGKLIIPPLYKKLIPQESIVIYQSKYEYGFLNRQGDTLVAKVGVPFEKHGMYQLTGKNRLRALYDTTGQAISDFIYTQFRYREKYTIGFKTDGTHDLIDEGGKYINLPLNRITDLITVNDTQWFGGNIAPDNFNFYNLKGERLFDIDTTGFEYVRQLNDTLFDVRTPYDLKLKGPTYYFIDQNGHRINDQNYARLTKLQYGGAVADLRTFEKGKMVIKYGYLNPQLKFKEVGYKNRKVFANGSAIFCQNNNWGESNTCAMINSDLEITVPMSRGYYRIQVGHDSTFLARKGKHYYFLDNKGQEMFGKKFNYAEGFIKGMAFADSQLIHISGRPYINKKIAKRNHRKHWTKTNPKFEFCPIRVGDKSGFYNQRTREFPELKYDHVWPFIKGYSTVKMDNEWGLVDTTGTLVWSQPLKKLWYMVTLTEGEPCFTFQKNNGLYGIIDAYQNIIVPAKYESLEHHPTQPYFQYQSREYYLVEAKKNGKVGVLLLSQPIKGTKGENLVKDRETSVTSTTKTSTKEPVAEEKTKWSFWAFLKRLFTRKNKDQS